MSQLSPEGFARRFTDCSRMLWCIATAVTRDPGQAEDVLQEAALIGLQKLATFDAQTDFPAWMSRIVRYVALNAARRRGARQGIATDPALLSTAPSPPPAQAAPISPRGEVAPDQESFDDRVIWALGRLEETARARLLLRVLLDLPYREIAVSLGIPEGTAMSHVHRARRAMSADLAGLGDGGLFMNRPDPARDHESEARLEARVDEVLRRMIVPPSRERLAAIAARALREAAPASAAPARYRLPLRRMLPLAAGLAATIAGAWLAWAALAPHRAASPYDTTWRSFQTAYQEWTVAGFKPQWQCRNDEEFARSFRNTLHEGLLLKALPPDTETLGLAVCNSLSPRTTCVLARSGGQPVVVFVDRVESDAAVEKPAGLNMFRRQLDRLVLYEVSALEAPVLLDLFYCPGNALGENGT